MVQPTALRNSSIHTQINPTLFTPFGDNSILVLWFDKDN